MEMNFEKNVPLPERRYDSNERKYDWTKMEVGDSIVGTKAMLSAARNWTAIHKEYKFTSRKLDKEATQLRIWRVR